jgi:thiol-disulfide isomerase/thioredoxin
MDIKSKTALILLAALLMLVTGCHTSKEESSTPESASTVKGIEIGSIAPDFTLINLEGETINLSDFKSSPVMLNFWATWCGPCRNEMPYIQEVYEKWKDSNLVILTINNREEISTVSQFMQENDLSFPVLLDTLGDVFSKYEIRYIPTTFFIDKDGIIKDKRIGSFENAAAIESCLEIIMH